jgi:enamidase
MEGPLDVRIDDGLIAEIAPSRATRSAEDIDGSGLVLLPGLWDAHHHPFFGDHTPQFDARGYLAETVRAGTTTIVSAGAFDFPGRPRDAAGESEVAVLSQRSWIHDRPLEINVLADTVVAAAGMREHDFAVLAGSGIHRLVVGPVPVPSDEVRRQIGWARAQGMKVVAHGDASLDADIVLSVNGGDVPLPDDVIERLLAGSAALELSLTGDLRTARRVASALVARGQPERVVLGSETPSARGVIPPAMQRMVQAVIDEKVSPALAIAFASGNTARANGAVGGRIEVGQAADVVLAAPARGSRAADALDALGHGEWLHIEGVLIQGAKQA